MRWSWMKWMLAGAAITVLALLTREILMFCIIAWKLRRTKKKFPAPPELKQRRRGWAVEEFNRISGRRRIVSTGWPNAEKAIDEALLHRTCLMMDAGGNPKKRALAESAEMSVIGPSGMRSPVISFAKMDNY